MISRKHLGDDEQVVLAIRRHLKTLVGPAVLFVLVCASAGGLAAVVPAGDTRRWLQLIIGAIALVVTCRWVLWPLLSWRAATYVVTTERILTKHGVIRQHGRSMPLPRVNDVAFESGLLDRIVGCGTLVVSSGGELGQLVLTDVPHVASVQRTIYDLVEGTAHQGPAGVPDRWGALDR